ncbi:hypothetical protein PENSPDRAFT_623890 [Peniophora sp. CONT]|nr:hypothetical protein PENSPDRAFT_623890 [Peniophora sp. CONT]
MDLSTHQVSGSDRTYYIPEFVNAEEEEYLIRKILETQQPKWRQLANRRLQTWGGDLTPKNILIPQPMPSIMTDYPDLIARLKATTAFAGSPHGEPNHVIMNEYLPGQGIMPHQDGPAYHPVVATLSLGTHTVMHYYQYKSDEDRAIDPIPVLSFLLEPRSLVITTQALYETHLHGIDPVEEDSMEGVQLGNAEMIRGEREREAIEKGGVLERGTRFSLTCRDVARVASVSTAKMFGRK